MAVLRSDDLACFARVAAAGGFGPAASALGLDVVDLRRRVAALEAALGVELVEHGSDELRLTDAGRALAATLTRPSVRTERAVRARREARAREATRRGGAARTTETAGADTAPRVRVSATPLLTATVLPAVLVAYAAAKPDVRLAFGPELLDPEVTIGHGWRMSRPPTGALASAGLRLVAAPRWVVAHGEPRSVDDLAHAPTLVWPLGHGPARWPLVVGDRVEEVPVRARLRCSDLGTVRTAALQGLGPTLLPDAAVADDLAAGRLVPLGHVEVGQLGEIVVHHARTGLTDAATDFVRFALDRLGAA